ncbi:hypothetical protein Mapa_002043 [Marchantia paleacea]|nr:hypothetical protein Mapa_002043 [Marchantia paleacea]
MVQIPKIMNPSQSEKVPRCTSWRCPRLLRCWRRKWRSAPKSKSPMITSQSGQLNEL